MERRLEVLMEFKICDLCLNENDGLFNSYDIAITNKNGYDLCDFHAAALEDFIGNGNHWEYRLRPGDKDYKEEIGKYYNPYYITIHKGEE